MANRAMAAKVIRAKREAREAVHVEYSKADYIAHVDYVPAYDERMVRRVSNAAKPAPKPRAMVAWSKPSTTKNVTPAQAAWTCDGPAFGLIRRQR